MSTTRRSFFSWTRNALAASGLVSTAPLAAEAAPATAADYYTKLGVTKIINAAGTYTSLTASIMPPSVQAAVAQAAKNPVRLAELQRKAGSPSTQFRYAADSPIADLEQRQARLRCFRVTSDDYENASRRPTNQAPY